MKHMFRKIMLVLFFFCLVFKIDVCAEEGSQEYEATTEIEEPYEVEYSSDHEKTYQELYDMLQIKDIERQIDAAGIGNQISLSNIIDGLIKGDSEYVSKYIISAIKNLLLGEVLVNRSLMLQLIIIVLMGSVFVNLSGSFGNAFVSENGFYVTYLIITSIMLTSFSVSLELVSGSIEKVLVLIRIIVPLYALAMNFLGHITTSAGMYEVILLGVWLVQVVILKIIIPMIKFYVIVSLVNNLNKENSFSKLCKLIKNMVSWLLKTIVVFIAGLNIIKSLIEPQIDALNKNTMSKIISSLPGGGITSVLAGTLLGAGAVVKNSIGIAGIIIILIIVLIPVIKTFFLMFAVRLTGVLIQPVGEKRYVNGVEALASGMSLLLQTIFSSVVLFVLTIAIMAYASSGG